jgi:hypothetical protein
MKRILGWLAIGLAAGWSASATPYYAYVPHKPTPGWQTPHGMGIPVYDPAYGPVPPQKKKR